LYFCIFCLHFLIALYIFPASYTDEYIGINYIFEKNSNSVAALGGDKHSYSEAINATNQR